MALKVSTYVHGRLGVKAVTYRERERITVSFLIALSIHLLLFLVLQLVVRFEESRIQDYSGPLFVQIESEVVPTIRSKPAEEKQRERVTDQSPAQSREQPAGAGTRPEVVEPERSPDSYLYDSPLPEWSAVTPPGEVRPESISPIETVPSMDRPPDKPEEMVPPASPPAPHSPAVKPLPADEYSPLVELDKLDRALAERQVDSDSSEPAAETPAGETQPVDGESERQPVHTDRSGFVIEWEDPTSGREAVNRVEPRIPQWVSKDGLRLKVVVAFVLTPQGILSSVKVEESSGYSDVDSAVREAVRKWKFKAVSSSRQVRGRLSYKITLN